MSEILNPIYSTYDAGDVVIFDNNVYIKEGLTLQQPNRSPNINDISNISPITFIYDDNNDENGSIHRTWSKIEVAISNLSKYTSKVLLNPNCGDVEMAPSYCDKNVIFNVPDNGILRVTLGNVLNSPSIFRVVINGVDFQFTYLQNPSTTNSLAFRVCKNDIISIPDNIYSRVFMLPYTYPSEN